jgi:hypothetical protein
MPGLFIRYRLYRRLRKGRESCVSPKSAKIDCSAAAGCNSCLPECLLSESSITMGLSYCPADRSEGGYNLRGRHFRIAKSDRFYKGPARPFRCVAHCSSLDCASTLFCGPSRAGHCAPDGHLRGRRVSRSRDKTPYRRFFPAPAGGVRSTLNNRLEQDHLDGAVRELTGSLA